MRITKSAAAAVIFSIASTLHIESARFKNIFPYSLSMVPPVFAAPKVSLDEVVRSLGSILKRLGLSEANPDQKKAIRQMVMDAYNKLEANPNVRGGQLFDIVREQMYGKKKGPKPEKVSPSSDKKQVPVPNKDKTKDIITPIERFLIKGETEFTNKNYDGAIENFNRAYKLDPKNFRAVYNLATAYAYAAHTSEAIKFYREALSIAPDEQNKSRVNAQIASLLKTPAAEPKTPIRTTKNADSILKEFKGENGNAINVMEIISQLGLYGENSHVIRADARQKDPNEEKRIKAVQGILIEAYGLLKTNGSFITFLRGRLRELSGGKTTDERAEKRILSGLINGEMPLEISSRYDQTTRILVELLQLYSNRLCTINDSYNQALERYNRYFDQNRADLSQYAQKRLDTYWKGDNLRYRNFIVSDNGEFDAQTLVALAVIYGTSKRISVNLNAQEIPKPAAPKPAGRVQIIEDKETEQPSKKSEEKKDNDMPVF